MTNVVSWLEAELGRVEELARAAGGDAWSLQEHPSDTVAVYDSRREPVVYDEGWPSEAQKEHIAEHDPVSVLRRVKADRAILADLVAERHLVVDGDCWFTCPAATEDRDGGECCDDDRRGGPCDCGRDARVGRRVRLLAQAWGWTGR